MLQTKHLLKNQSGMNLLSVLGTMAILGAGVVGVTNLIKMTNTGQDSASRKIDAISLTSMIEIKLKSVFLNTKGISGNLNSGLCELVKVNDPNSSLTNVYLQLPNPSKSDLFSPYIWSRAFSEFIPVANGVEGCNLTSKYGRCFKFNPNSDSNLGAAKDILLKLNPIFEINIKTMLLNPAAQNPFLEVVADGDKRYDLKAISFQYSIRTIYNSRAGDENIGSRFLKSFIWSGDAGVCQVGDRKISLTGSSLGDPEAQTSFNLPGFSSDSLSATNNPPISLFFNKSQIRSGQQTVNASLDSQFLTSSEVDHPLTGPVYSACNESVFQCPQLAASNTRVYQPMRHLLKAQYQSPNVISNSGTEIQIAPHVKFKSLNGLTLPETYYESFKVGSRNFIKDNDQWFYDSAFLTKSMLAIKVPLKIGATTTVTTRLADSSFSSTANNVCREICVPTTNFNSSETQNYNSFFSYNVKITNPAPNKVTTFEESGGPVACTACYMKNCDQFGLGTFGAMQVQPTEPLDAGVPFCVQHEEHVRNFYEMPNFDLGPSNASKCLSARLNSGDLSGFSYSASECDSSKPVMCFAFGKHMLAKSVTLTSSSLVLKNFNAANDACFALGKENLKKIPLRTLFSQQGNLGKNELNLLGISDAEAKIDPSARMDVINFIAQGSFFAPVGSNQEKMLRKFAEGINGDKPDLLKNDFWIGLRTDNLGYVFSPAPKLSNLALSPDVKWGLHYDGFGKLIVKKVSNSLGFSKSAVSSLPYGGKAGLLYHTDRFKGVYFGFSSQPYGDKKLRSLCRKKSYPHELFISTNRTNSFLASHSICNDEGGLFLPPLTTAGWEVALQLVAPESAKHPFPVATDFDPAWVNYTQTGTTESINLDIMKTGLSKFLNKNGEFVQEEAPAQGESVSPQEKSSYARACFDSAKGEIRILSSCDFGSRSLSVAEVSAAANSSNIYLRFMLKAALANNSSFSLIKLYDK